MKIKQGIFTIVGFLWLSICMTVCISIFMNRGKAELAFDAFFQFRQNPFFYGGDPVMNVDHGGFTASIHEPVYQGYPIRNRHGYIHIQWSWEQEGPALIDQKYDLDGDSAPDIRLKYNRDSGELAWESLNRDVLGPLVTNSILTFLRVGKTGDKLIYHLDDRNEAVKIMIKRGFADNYYQK